MTISKKVTTKGSTLEEDSRSNAREEEEKAPKSSSLDDGKSVTLERGES